MKYAIICNFIALWIMVVFLTLSVMLNNRSNKQDLDLLADIVVGMLKVDKTLINAFHGHIIHHQETWLEDPNDAWPRELRARPL